APEFEIIVACDPRLPDIDAIRQKFPEERIVINFGQRTPLELASRAVRECRGELILLTKDHCVPSPDWVRAMVDAQCKGRAVVGGRVEIGPEASTTEWAYFFIDFFRYAEPAAAGAATSLTVCNVAYKRAELDAVSDLWKETFVETAINDALCARFGILWLTPASEVTMYRHITLRDAIHECYTYGRLFGYSRLSRWSLPWRLVYALGAPVLPFLLLGRMVRVVSGSRRNQRTFIRSFAPLALMVMARCWGEWLAYLTGHYPRSWDGAEIS
ncbi:MAG: glycosyltransferase, partial [Gammaproteobacteria bacterium]|nr:glycosyltransferase [Gammaproteobacteria bacterium]